MMSLEYPVAYLVVNAMLKALYPLWALIWAGVAFHYGRAAYASYLRSGSGPTRIISDFLAPITWAFRETACRFRIGSWHPLAHLAQCPNSVGALSPQEPGQLLRFSIFLGSLSPVMFGAVYLDIERTTWSVSEVLVNLTTVVISIVAAMGHMFLAFLGQTESWRFLVITSTLWMLVASPGYALFSLYLAR